MSRSPTATIVISLTQYCVTTGLASFHIKKRYVRVEDGNKPVEFRNLLSYIANEAIAIRKVVLTHEQQRGRGPIFPLCVVAEASKMFHS